jgi:hypothetical protein
LQQVEWCVHDIYQSITILLWQPVRRANAHITVLLMCADALTTTAK